MKRGGLLSESVMLVGTQDKFEVPAMNRWDYIVNQEGCYEYLTSLEYKFYKKQEGICITRSNYANSNMRVSSGIEELLKVEKFLLQEEAFLPECKSILEDISKFRI